MSIETGGLSSEQGEIDENEQQRQRALEALKKRGYIEYSEDNQIIADTERINQYTSLSQGPHASLARRLQDIYGSNGFYALQNVFHNQPVISREDWDAGAREPKPLFYDPASDEAALNQQTIREADFYLNPWKSNRKVNYPGLREVNGNEANIALLINHPEYGDGFRDPKNGKLMVRDINHRYQPITYDYFTKNYGFDPRIDYRKGGGFSGSPNRFLEQTGQHLIEKGILTTDDFRTLHRTGEGLPTQTTKEVDKNGFVFLDGIRYYVGKNRRGAKAVVVDNKTALVLEGEEDQITHYFQLKSELRQGNESLITLNAPETNLQPFNRETFMQKLEGETDDDYQKRLEALQEFETKPIQTEDLSPKDRAKMKAISRQNWSQIDSPELGGKVADDFDQFLDENRPGRWYLAQLNNELLGFIRFDDISDDEVYAGSLNVNLNSRNAQIGESILKSSLIKESAHKKVKGFAYGNSPILKKYIGTYGFTATGVEKSDDYGSVFFEMEIDREKNESYQFTAGDRQEALKYYDNNNLRPDDDIIVLRYNPAEELDAMMSASQSVFALGGRVMTAFMEDSRDKNYRYLVFEKQEQEDLQIAA